MDSVFLQISDILPIIAIVISASTAVGVGIGLYLQKKSSEMSAYDRLRADHIEILRLVVTNPHLKKIYDDKEKKEYKNVSEVKLSQADHQIINYYALEFDLYERLVEAFEDEKLFDEKEWNMWLEWLRSISKNWRFGYTINKHGEVWDVRAMIAICEKFKINVVNEKLEKKFKEHDPNFDPTYSKQEIRS